MPEALVLDASAALSLLLGERDGALVRDRVVAGAGGRMLVLDLFCLQRLLGHTLDELGVEQLIFALVMDVQCGDGEIDVVGQERNPPR